MFNYGSSDSTKSLASDIATVSEPRHIPQVRRISDSAFGAVAVPVFLRILSCSVTHL